MDIRQLRYFVGIVQAGSLSRAADQLHVAQSAVSHHLNSLESELDRQLLTRGPKGIMLTDAGAVLYQHAEAILYSISDAVLVTADSVSMISEAAATGKPVHILGLAGNGGKFAQFHDTMRRAGITRPFAGRIESWSYAPLDDTARAGAALRELVLGRLAARGAA